MSVPLDAWDVNREEGTTFLWAERVARRVQSKAAELGADVLVCVTRHWLRDDNWLYRYGWWPNNGKPPVVIFSIAGFEELQPEGPQTDRVVANAMVTGLAGFYGEVGTHEKGAKDCPLSFNQNRDLAHLVARQRFDAGCRRRLGRKLGAKLEALDRLLEVFPWRN